MDFFDCLLIGKELINKVKTSIVDWGFINGFAYEDVIGAFSADIGEEKPVVSKASWLISEHRFFNNYKKGVLLWAKVSNDVIKQIKGIEHTLDEVKEKLPADLCDKLKDEGLHYLLLLGETNKDYKYYLVYTDREEKLAFFSGDIETIDEEPNPFRRIDGLVPLEKLKEKKVAIIGAGSGGSFISLELAAAGVGTLYLFDYDRLSAVNLFRHTCDRRDLGRKKINALSDTIEEHLLPTKVIKEDRNIIDDPKRFREVACEVDLIICATDNVKSRELANYVSIFTPKPLILVCTFDNARIGEVIKVIPKQTACYECVRIHQREHGSLITNDDTGSEVIPYSSQSDSKANESIGTRTDVFMVAAIATKVALMSLADDKTVFGNLPYNYLVWGSVRNTEYNPPFNFDNPFTVNYSNYQIHPKCAICGDLPPELDGINIEEQYNEIVAELSPK